MQKIKTPKLVKRGEYVITELDDEYRFILMIIKA